MKHIKLFESFEDIDSICKKYRIKDYAINTDGSVDVDDDVSLSSRELTKLPLKFGRVSGYFNCIENQLTTLEGAPREVGRGFYCSYNKLTSLEGCPQSVGGNFNCSENQLTTLEGAPERVGGNFNCDFNKLTTLEGAPREVGEDFNCYKNKLTTLEGAPERVGGNFNCYKNQLSTLEGAPERVGGNFYCEYNPVYAIYKLFKNHKDFIYSLDWDYIRKDKETNQDQIDMSRFEDACAEAGIKIPKSIKGYKYI